DERRFATAARVSETNLALYRTYMQPFVKAVANPVLANWMQQLHPLRLQYELFSDANPFMAPVKAAAERVRSERKEASADNPFLAMQEKVSQQIVTALDTWRETVEQAAERTFLTIYGTPALQAACGVDPQTSQRSLRKAAKSPLHQQLVGKRIAELRAKIGTGGLRECMVRAALYIGMARGAADERGFETIRRIRLATTETQKLTLAQFKQLVREQFSMLLIDEEAALAAIPSLLPPGADERKAALAAVQEVATASGDLAGEAAKRMERVAGLFDGGKPRLAPVEMRTQANS
ncbi:MAG: DUF3141 domain-containing protein, partial [Pseudorhodoplanes sp.]